MAEPLVFLTHATEARTLYYGPAALAALRQQAELRLNPRNAPLSLSELIERAVGAHIIVADRATPGKAGLFAALPDPVALVRCAVDIGTVDVPAASHAGVLVTRATPGFAAAVAELALGFMIDLGRGISRAGIAYRDGRAPPVAMGRQVAGATVGIIGFGVIGRRLAGILRAMDAEVLVCDPHAAIDPALGHATELDALLARADFVVCLAAASPATENLINANRLARMRPGAYFINGSRGSLVDEAALVAALDSGHLGGLTPQAAQHQAMETTRQVAEILAGRIPAGAVNAPAAGRLRVPWRERDLV